jgi:hypothetical protein
MGYFRVVHVRPSRPTGDDGWAVERTALGERGGIVSASFPSKELAAAERDKLRAEEARKTGK